MLQFSLGEGLAGLSITGIKLSADIAAIMNFDTINLHRFGQ